jgi:preprotein translocase subunit YajC
MEVVRYIIAFQVLIALVTLGIIIYLIIRRRRKKGLERFEKRDY